MNLAGRRSTPFFHKIVIEALDTRFSATGAKMAEIRRFRDGEDSRIAENPRVSRCVLFGREKARRSGSGGLKLKPR
jgi:hypothetical protein